MPGTPSDDQTRIKRIQALCAQVSKTVRRSRQQRQTALRLAREALKLAESAGLKRRAKTKPKS